MPSKDKESLPLNPESDSKDSTAPASEQPGTDNTDNAAPEPLHEQENASSNLPALKKKRSHEESEETTTSSDPETKRVACDTNPPESVASSTTEGSKGVRMPNNAKPQNDVVLNPSKKRSRDDDDEDADSTAAGVKTAEDAPKSDEPEKKRQHIEPISRKQAAKDKDTEKQDKEPEPTEATDAKEEPNPAKESSSSAEKPAAPKLPNPFSDTSKMSPFARLAQSSTLSSFKSAPADAKSNQETKTPETTDKPEPGTPASTTSSKLPNFSFGSLAGGFAASPFATATGFAAAKGPKLSSFGTGSSFTSGSKPAPWGAQTDKAKPLAPTGPTLLSTLGSKTKSLATLTAEAAEDEKKRAEERAKTVTGVTLKEDPVEEQGDKRFQQQKTETGEEEETTVFASRAKLFCFTNGEWKERGAGNLKVNVSAPDDDGAEDEEGKSTKKRARARIVMRAEGVWRVILNTSLFKGMKFGNAEGKLPTTKAVNLTAVEDGRPVLYTIRVHNVDIAQDLYKTVHEVLKKL